MENIIGREQEKAVLFEALNSNDPELIAVYGRRRVGKTFLIRNSYEKYMALEFSGMYNASSASQLENFTIALSNVTGSTIPLAKPDSWLQAFKTLTDYLSPLIKKQKKVIFFDEFPWINTHRSGFLQAFENFWNSWASKQKNIVVVICGSAATWMIQKVVNNRGGLHNRVTRKIRLLPFTLFETETYLKERKINLDRYQILQLYMVTGGIPQYLKEVKKGESSTQAIDRICFTKDGWLHDEFKNLYSSLFENANSHIEIIKALTQKASGLTRNEIIETCKFTSGGGTTKLLEELSESGFITAYIPFGKSSKDNVYKLSDEYSLFYCKFIENSRSTGAGTWIRLSRETSWKSWSGIAFESICMKHTPQIKKALGIEGVYSETSVWRSMRVEDQKGAQIDLLIDRQDNCINVCEIKFSLSAFTIDKYYADELRQKIDVFRTQTKTKKTIFLTMITTYGVKQNAYYTGLVQNDLLMDVLFI